MPKLRNDVISRGDLQEYLESYSDFSFELRVLKSLRDMDVFCEHGGLYEDPVTKKSREFDIRALVTHQQYRVRLAIECKNVRSYFPVLISCVPRHDFEAYHHVALVTEPQDEYYIGRYHKSRAIVIELTDSDSIYPAGQPVGKSIAQVGRGLDGTITVNDNELYDKWSQCLSSAHDLVQRTYYDRDDADPTVRYYSTVVPLVVVPDGNLWTVTYDASGNRLNDPEPSDRCPCFVDKDYWMGDNMAGARFRISHVEIVTFSGLRNFVVNYLGGPDLLKTTLFRAQGIVAGLKNV